MAGYYKNPDATAAAIDADGWLHTGDLGVVDADGAIFIRGRSKTMFLGPSGQNIYPEEIEAKLNSLPFVGESLVLERNGKLFALVYPDLERVDPCGSDERELVQRMEKNRLALNRILPAVRLDREDRRLLGGVPEDADEEDQAVPVLRRRLTRAPPARARVRYDGGMTHDVPAALAVLLALGASGAAATARHAADPGDGHVPRREGRRRLPLARERRRSEGRGVERRAERARARRFSTPARPRRRSPRGSSSSSPRAPRRSIRPSSAAGRRSPCAPIPPAKQQPWIVLLPSLAATDGMRAVVDPNVLDPTGHTAFDWFVPSPDGSRIAVSLSQGGSEAGTLHVFDVATGRETGDVIPRVQTGHGRRQRRLDRGRQGPLLHALSPRGRAAEGGPRLLPAGLLPRARHARSEDRYAFGKDLPRIAEISLRSSDDGRRHLAARPERRQRRLRALRPPGGRRDLADVSTFADGIVAARFGRGRLDLGDLEEGRAAPAGS